jgi:transposase
MNEHLDAISAQVQEGNHAAVIIDRAGWHMTDKLAVPENLTLVPLPPYSPELNGQEKIWQYMRDNYLSNRIFEDYEAILDACQSAWNALVSMPDRIKSVAAKSWLL